MSTGLRKSSIFFKSISTLFQKIQYGQIKKMFAVTLTTKGNTS